MARRDSEGPHPPPRNRSSRAKFATSDGEATTPATPTDGALSDPITAALGHSTELKPVLEFKWPGHRVGYLTVDAAHAMKRAAVLAAKRVTPGATDAGAVLVTLPDVLRAIVGLHLVDRESKWSEDLVAALRHADIGIDQIIDAQTRETLLGEIDRVSHESALLRWDVVTVLAEASRIRQRTDPDLPDIGMRHIVVGAFFSKEGQLSLRETGLIRNGLRNTQAALAENLSRELLLKYGDDAEAWQAEFHRLQEQTELVGPERSHTRPAYDSDIVTLHKGDPLGVAADAKALADLILLEGLRPPLAIGLFGPWGSGKSTLIRSLRSEIDEQTAEERQLPNPPGERDELARVRHVVHLEFNAWTFVDSENLWASFTAEVFDQLAAGGASRWQASHGANLVATVRSRLTAESGGLEAAAAASENYELAIRDADDRIAEAEDARRLASLNAAWETARDLVGGNRAVSEYARPSYLEADKSFNRETKTAFAAFRDGLIGPGALTEARIAPFGRNLLAVGRTTLAVWRNAAVSRPKLMGLALLLLLLAVAWAVASRLIGAKTPAWIDNAGWLAIAGAAVANVVWPLVRMLGVFVDKRRASRKTALKAIAEAREARRIAQVKRSEADAECMRRNEFIKTYGNDGSSRPGAILKYLLSESEDLTIVRAQTGLLSVIRRCFQQLDAVLTQMRANASGTDVPIERIVLYIDDLDRCSAEQVVEILQLVHLLLAFECFVVVVAVDATWLKRSLLQVHDQFTTANDPSLRRPTVEDYLEKIFQIPFWVKPMIDGDAPEARRYAAYQDYVDDLLGFADASHSGGEADNRSGRDPVPESGAGDTFALGVFKAALPAAPEDVEAPRRERVTLTPAEHQLFRNLGPLAAKSPRSVKRMINIYRLVRVRLGPAELAAFLQPSSQCMYGGALLALALEVGLRPELLSTVHSTLRALDSATWEAFRDFSRNQARFAPAPLIEENIHLSKLCSELCRFEMWESFRCGINAVDESCGAAVTLPQLIAGFEVAQRYSFRA